MPSCASGDSLASAIGRAAPGDSLQRAPVLAAVRNALLSLPAQTLRVDRFEIQGVVGRGSFGVVYAAFDPQLDRRVALKVSARSNIAPSGLAEARIAARLSDPHVVTIYDCGRTSGRAWFAMELVEGPSLREHMGRLPRPVGEVLGLFVDAASGLAAAHEAGLVHRDFKPDNVLVGPDGRVKVADFGLAVCVEEASAGRLAGTPAYMAPEQMLGRSVDARADQFALCVSLFEAVVGHRPFGTSSKTAVLRSIRTGLGSTPPPGVPRRLFAALRRGLAFEPSERYPSMGELGAALATSNRPRRLRRWGALSLLAGSVVAPVVVGSVLPDNVAFGRSDCQPNTEKIAEVWSAAHVERLPEAPEWGRPSLRHTIGRLDSYAAQWTSAYELACRAGVSSGAGQRCLREARIELRAVAQALTAMAPSELFGAHRLLAGLRPLQDCEREHNSSGSEASVGAWAPELTEQLAIAEAEYAAGRHERSRALAWEAVQTARDRGLPGWEAKALTLVGIMEHSMGDSDAVATLEQAVWLAQSAGESDVQLHAATVLIYAAGLQRAELTVAQRWAAYADAELERSGGTVDRRVELAIARGQIAYEGMKPRDALVQLDVARSLMVADGYAQTAVPDLYSGMAWRSLGDLDRAIELQTRAHQTMAAQLGAQHPELERFAIALAQSCAADGRHVRAVELYRQVQARAVPSHGPPEVLVLVELARSLRALSRLDEAQEAAARAAQIAEAEPSMASLADAASLELGAVAMRKGDLTEAQRRLRPIAQRPWTANRGDRIHDLEAKTALSEIQRRRQNYGAARELLDEVHARTREVYGDEHPDTIVAAQRVAAAGQWPS